MQITVNKNSHNPYSCDGEDGQTDRKDHPQGHDDRQQIFTAKHQTERTTIYKKHLKIYKINLTINHSKCLSFCYTCLNKKCDKNVFSF